MAAGHGGARDIGSEAASLYVPGGTQAQRHAHAACMVLENAGSSVCSDVVCAVQPCLPLSPPPEDAEEIVDLRHRAASHAGFRARAK